MTIRNHKDLAGSMELTRYCSRHGYDLVWDRWLDSIRFTRRKDGQELMICKGTSIADLLRALQEQPPAAFSDPLAPYLVPAPPEPPGALL